jgi:hypothetical protein
VEAVPEFEEVSPQESAEPAEGEEPELEDITLDLGSEDILEAEPAQEASLESVEPELSEISLSDETIPELGETEPKIEFGEIALEEPEEIKLELNEEQFEVGPEEDITPPSSIRETPRAAAPKAQPIPEPAPKSQPMPEPAPQAKAPEQQDALKKDIKSVLKYMDKLLESLPEDKIEEFAKSEHFAVYKKLFEELGLV